MFIKWPESPTAKEPQVKNDGMFILQLDGRGFFML
jgi:hypothetical protein